MKPVHPLLVHFPIALLFLSVTADLVAFFSNSVSLQGAGWWALFGAALGGTATVAAGIYDMRRATLREGLHRLVHQHMKVGLTLLAAIVGLTAWRWTVYKQPGDPVTAVYLDAAVLTMGLAGFQGWLGGELVYVYGVFVQNTASGAKRDADPADAQNHHHQ